MAFENVWTGKDFEVKEAKPLQLWWWSCDHAANLIEPDHGYFEDLGVSRIYVMARSKMGAAYHLCNAIHISYTERRIVLAMIRRMNSFHKGWGKFEEEVKAVITPSEKGGVWGRVSGKWDTIVPLGDKFEEGTKEERCSKRPKDNGAEDELLDKAQMAEVRKLNKMFYDSDRRRRKKREALQASRAPRLLELRAKVKSVLDARWDVILSNERARVAAEAVRRVMTLHSRAVTDHGLKLWTPEVFTWSEGDDWQFESRRRKEAA